MRHLFIIIPRRFEMKKLAAATVLLVLCLAAGFASGSTEKLNLNFGGSTTVLPIMESAIEAYQKMHPQVTISYEAQGSSVGIKGVTAGTYSLGASSRNLTDAEKAAGVQATAIALDGVALVINAKTPIGNLSLEQAAKIFAGQITNWKDVGGPDAAIVVINRDEASGTRETFLETCLRPGAGKDTKFLNSAIIVESNGDMVQKVGATPNAIGYCGFGYIDGARQAGAKDISVAGIMPVEKNVLNGTYPCSRKLWVVHKGALKDKTVENDFVQFLLSKPGQKIVVDQKFIALQ
jgi:phosphate transport system substrate-binding protein